jgi:hypothetical protein
MSGCSLRAALVAAWSVVAVVVGGGVGAAADDPVAELLGDVGFSVSSGTFTGELSVSLTTPVTGAEIRYTTDGALPGPDSTRFTGDPVLLTGTTQLRAQPFVDGVAAGEPGTALYLENAVDTLHDLPVVVMDDYAAGLPEKEDGYKDAAVMVFEPGSRTGTTGLGYAPTLASRGGIHVRGQSSSDFDKTAYRLELWDNENDDADHPLLGMPADSDWVFRGPFMDKSLIRDALTYSLGRDMGLRTPRFALCELYLNLDGGPLGPADYQGVYLVSETVKVSDDRLDIANLKKADLAPPAVEGGYVLKFDWQVAEAPMLTCTGSTSSCWRYLEVVEPDPLQPEQQAWITQYVQQVHDSLHAADFADPQTGYAAWIDVPSFVDVVIINELSRNVDGYIRSTYLHKDRGGKLAAGPLWDYDLAWGTGGIRRNLEIQGWQYEQQRVNPPANDWFSRLFQDPAFVDRVAARWQELRGGVLSDAALDARIDELATPLAGAADRNFQRWPNLTRARIVNWATTPTAATWQGQVDYLRDWAHQRAAWLDTQWG